ncbi:MAG: hypothetical protein ACRC6X_02175 [Culicoidibacterales bacterium]
MYPAVDQRPALRVEALMFRFKKIAKQYQLQIALIKSEVEPAKHHYVLPGGFVTRAQTTTTALISIIMTKTALNITDFYTEQLATYSQPNHQNWVISVAHIVMTRNDTPDNPKDSYPLLHWLNIADITPQQLAFDHFQIFTHAITRLKNKALYQPIQLHLLHQTDSTYKAKKLTECLFGKPFDNNFYRDYGTLFENYRKDIPGG